MTTNLIVSALSDYDSRNIFGVQKIENQDITDLLNEFTNDLILHISDPECEVMTRNLLYTSQRIRTLIFSLEIPDFEDIKEVQND